ncbi:SBBP repeat-containing protein [Aerosakkonemataceae cyanobacterium BLCC-F154]|uniref:SBBP repeat-containing protein n=1 Tax=Floridaenema fluviatile BLCC-F154 TaxID=3153640 RepID=A0ABV4YFY8_9CYAN
MLAEQLPIQPLPPLNIENNSCFPGNVICDELDIPISSGMGGANISDEISNYETIINAATNSTCTNIVEGDFLWANAVTGNAFASFGGLGIVTDSEGNVYTTGVFGGTTDFDPGDEVFNLTSTGEDDIFISKFNGDGSFAWATSLGSEAPISQNNDMGFDIALDDAGNVYITGITKGNYYNISTGNFGNSDVFVAKLSNDGNPLWSKSMGGSGSDAGSGVAVDDAGNVYTIGYFSGIADLDPGEGTFNVVSKGEQDIFISKLDSDGNFVWAQVIDDSDRWYGNDGGSLNIAVDSVGNVYTTDFFRGTVDFDPGEGIFNLTSAGESDIFISKLNSDGSFGWAKAIGSSGEDGGSSSNLTDKTIYSNTSSSISIDNTDTLYVTGRFSGTVDFDPGEGIFNLTSQGTSERFVSKFNSDGTFVWVKGIGAQIYETNTVFDSAGNIYTTGGFSGTVDFDPGEGVFNLSSQGRNPNFFVTKLNSDGSFAWAKAAEGGFQHQGKDVAVDNAGNVLTTGYYWGTTDFDPGSGVYNLLPGSIGPSIFTLKLASGSGITEY